jgi:protein-tyrosine phosphatase/arsenate reductase
MEKVTTLFAFASLGLLLLMPGVALAQGQGFYPALQTTIAQLEKEESLIDADRRTVLASMAAYVSAQLKSGKPAQVVVICTHNSRRSHLGQVWLQTAAAYYNVGGFQSFSGGTEATAFNIRAANALARAGFRVVRGPGENPVYQLYTGQGATAIECFSKKYTDAPNPSTNFCALMVCSDADKACPLVRGAAMRLSLPTPDPKAYDGKPDEEKQYDATARLLGREMVWVMRTVAQSLQKAN